MSAPKMTRENAEETDFILKTANKQRKKNGLQELASIDNVIKSDSVLNEGISLRPRTMFGSKGKGKEEALEGSPYRPQWSKDGDGFVSTMKDVTMKACQDQTITPQRTNTGKKEDLNRRKSKVLRYSREELLALHVPNTTVPEFMPDTVVASEYCLPPVGSLPFDHSEIYKQWAANKNRGRGRGRGAVQPHHQRSDSYKGEPDRKNKNGEEDENAWQKHEKTQHINTDMWDDVTPAKNDMDLASMAQAAENFRAEMESMRKANELQTAETIPISDDMDYFDEKLEKAAIAGQFDNSDTEPTEWVMPDPIPDLIPDNVHTIKDVEPIAPLDPFLQCKIEPDISPLVKDNSSHLTVDVLDEWFYLDPQGQQQGPFKTNEMREWFEAGYFKPHLPIRFGHEGGFTSLANHFPVDELPFSVIPRARHTDFERQHLFALQQQHLAQMQQQQQQQLSQCSLNDTSNLDLPLSMSPQQRSHIFQQQHQHQQMLLQKAQDPFPVQNTPWTPSLPQKESKNIFDLVTEGRNLSPDSLPSHHKPNISSHATDTQSKHETPSLPSLMSFSNSRDMQVQATPAPNAWGEMPIPSHSTSRAPSAQTEISKRSHKDQEQATQHRQSNVKSTAWAQQPAVSITHMKSLKEIQDEESKKPTTDEESIDLKQMGADLKMMLGVDSSKLSSKSISSHPNQSGPWKTTATATVNGNSRKQSLREILEEEERLAQEKAKKSDTLAVSSHWSKVVSKNVTAPFVTNSNPLGPVPAAVMKTTKHSSAQDAQVKTHAALGTKPCELLSWCAKELEQIGGVKNLALMEYCATLEDPGEIRQYLAAYLGSIPRVSAFATEFIERKKKAQCKLKTLDSESNVLNGKKSRRRTKGQRIDPSMLNYSIG